MDREKVIKSLHCRGQDLMIDLPACDGCNYQIQLVNRMGCDYRQICRDALALLKEQQHQIWEFQDQVEYLTDKLKEQEAVEPKVIRMNGFGDPVHACGKCGHSITESMNYCSWCGQAAKWE